MMKRFAIALVIAVCATGQDAPKAADPITDRMRLELALTQRDYLVAQAAFEAAKQKLAAATSKVSQVCEAGGASLDVSAIACIAKIGAGQTITERR